MPHLRVRNPECDQKRTLVFIMNWSSTRCAVAIKLRNSPSGCCINNFVYSSSKWTVEGILFGCASKLADNSTKSPEEKEIYWKTIPYSALVPYRSMLLATESMTTTLQSKRFYRTQMPYAIPRSRFTYTRVVHLFARQNGHTIAVLSKEENNQYVEFSSIFVSDKMHSCVSVWHIW